MSKYQTQIDSNDCICPYCGYRYQIECEDYDEARREEECGGCEKTFLVYQSFSVDTITEPSCTANEKEHDWQPMSIGDGKTHDFCSECGKCRPMAEQPGREEG